MKKNYNFLKFNQNIKNQKFKLVFYLLFICSLSSSINSYAQNTFQEIIRVVSDDISLGDYYGFSVDISGDYAVVGAYLEDPDGVSDAGAAYILHKNQGGVDNWGQIKKLQASDLEADDEFGRSVAISGNYVFVGAPREDTPANSAGAVYIFQKNQGGVDNWGQVKKLQENTPEDGDLFGWSMEVSGDYLIVGAYSEDLSGVNRCGAAFIFYKDQGGSNNWGEVQLIQAGDLGTNDNFGNDVSISGDYAIVGSPHENPGVNNGGAAYVFYKNQGGIDNWGQVKKITSGSGQSVEYVGRSVSISGNYAIVGASGENTNGNQSGAAYVFYKDQGGADNWGEAKKIHPSTPAVDTEFGYYVAILGDNAIVGASREDGANQNQGAAYTYSKDEGGADNWGETSKIGPPDPGHYSQFGLGIAMDGNQAIIGAHRYNNTGAAYVYYKSSEPGVPTLSEWGLIILALSFMTLGTLYLIQPNFRKNYK